DVGADHRDGLHNTVDDAQTVAGEQVIGEGVAGEACSHREDEQNATDNPVQFARLAECTGEEHAEHVHRNGCNEEDCRPVVNLAHEHTATHIEGDIQRRCIGGGHADALERVVRTVVDDVSHR